VHNTGILSAVFYHQKLTIGKLSKQRSHGTQDKLKAKRTHDHRWRRYHEWWQEDRIRRGKQGSHPSAK
jgi:hypothetical protein